MTPSIDCYWVGAVPKVETVAPKSVEGSVRGLIKGPYWEPQTGNPQEYSRYIIGIYLPRSLYSIIFLLYSLGSLFGVPSRVPLFKVPGSGPSARL